jgi:hypothetical protein
LGRGRRKTARREFMKCKSCGSKLPSGSDFCPICGAWNIPIPLDMLTEEEHINFESEEFADAYMREVKSVPSNVEEFEVDNEQLPLLFITQQAEKYGIAYAHRLKPLPELEISEKERVWLASAIDHDGSIEETTLRTRVKVDKIYLYRYRTPRVDYTTTTESLAEKFKKLTETPYWITTPPPPYKPAYRFSIFHSKAITTIIYTKPYLIRLSTTANKILSKYRHRPAIRIET